MYPAVQGHGLFESVGRGLTKLDPTRVIKETVEKVNEVLVKIDKEVTQPALQAAGNLAVTIDEKVTQAAVKAVDRGLVKLDNVAIQPTLEAVDEVLVKIDRHVTQPVFKFFSDVFEGSSDPSRTCNGAVRSHGKDLHDRVKQGQLMDASACGTGSILDLHVTRQHATGSIGMHRTLQILQPAFRHINITRTVTVPVPTTAGIPLHVSATDVHLQLAPSNDSLQANASICIGTTTPFTISQCIRTVVRVAATIDNGVLAVRLLDVDAAACFADGACAGNLGDDAGNWLGSVYTFAAFMMQHAVAAIKPSIVAAVVKAVNDNLDDANLAHELASVALPDGVNIRWATMHASIADGRLQFSADAAVAGIHGVALGDHGLRVCIGADGQWRAGAQAASHSVSQLAEKLMMHHISDIQKIYFDFETGGIALAMRAKAGDVRIHPKLGLTLRVLNGKLSGGIVCSELTAEGVDLGEKVIGAAANALWKALEPVVLFVIHVFAVPEVQRAMQRVALPQGLARLGSVDPQTMQLQLSLSVVFAEAGGNLNVPDLVARLAAKVKAWKP